MNSPQFIIYGAGKNGEANYNFISKLGKKDHVYAFCDKRYQEITSLQDKPVYSYESVKDLKLPFFVSIAGDVGREAGAMLRADNQTVYTTIDDLADLLGLDRVTFYREYCAFAHIENSYFQSAEDEAWLSVFWGKDSPFLRMFQQLDLSNVIELACGRGRHVQKYIAYAGEITLVDILSENIEFCKNRFQNNFNIHYYCNNGYNLRELGSGLYSALFSYDAVVHFEMMDIFEYLKDIYRVLLPGGLALFHHSNNDCDYKISFHTGVHNRNFMSQKIFAYLSYRAGFEVVEQQVIDWGVGGEVMKNLDCITLLKKPA